MNKYNSTTTLNHIRRGLPQSCLACEGSWRKLLLSQRKTKGDDEPIDLLTVWGALGWSDALWVLSYGMPDDRLSRHFRASCASKVLPIYEAEYPNDTCIRDQIAMLRDDKATDAERVVARDAAWDAAWVAARSAARDAAWNAAWDAAWDAARSAARGAAWDAAGAVTRDAARGDQQALLRKMLGETE